MKRLVLGSLLAFAPLDAPAFEGTYRGPTQEAVIRRLSGDDYQIDITTWQWPGGPSCGGYVRATATMRARENYVIARATNESPDQPEGPYCYLTLRFHRRLLRIETGHGCIEWHGASCDFTGDLNRR